MGNTKSIPTTTTKSADNSDDEIDIEEKAPTTTTTKKKGFHISFGSKKKKKKDKKKDKDKDKHDDKNKNGNGNGISNSNDATASNDDHDDDDEDEDHSVDSDGDAAAAAEENNKHDNTTTTTATTANGTTTKQQQQPERAVNQTKQPSEIMKRNSRDFFVEYTLGKKLGHGAYANVYMGVHNKTKTEYAIKHIMDRTMMCWHGRDCMTEEIRHLKMLHDAPTIVTCVDYYDGASSCYLIMEYLRGGELFRQVSKKGNFTESEARDACICVLNALDYMHDRRIVHRDLKPENLLLAKHDDFRSVKVCDFGFAKSLSSKNSARTRCGTPGYTAPEVLSRWPSYDVGCDMWSFGVIMFQLIDGQNPFDPPGTKEQEVIERTLNGQFYFRPKQWKDLSFESKDLIACCLKVNPNIRINAKTALDHEWIKSEKVSKRETRISAAALGETLEKIEKLRRQASEAEKRPNRRERVDKFNAEVEEFIKNHAGDSLVSLALTNRTGDGGGGGTTSPRGGVIGSGVTNYCSNAIEFFDEDSPSGRPFSDFYTITENIGKGTFGIVSRCKHKKLNRDFAVKEIDDCKMNKYEKKMLQDEIKVMKFLRGAPHVIRLYDVFVEPEKQKTYMVLEEMRGGDLLDRITQKTLYTELEARNLGKYLFTAVKYCHSKNIAHRDIKLENLLLREVKNDASIKLADFGFAKRTPHGKGMRTYCGTAKYMAPEIFLTKTQRSSYDCACDMWSVGVVMYTLLTGYLPFNEKDPEKLEEKVVKGDYAFYLGDWVNKSESSRKMVSKMLKVDPQQRMTAEQALECEWMEIHDENLITRDLSDSKQRLSALRNSIREEKNKFKAAVKAVIATQALMEKLPVEKDHVEEEKFENQFSLGEQIMVTNYGEIHEATHNSSGTKYAVKRIVRRFLQPQDAIAVNNEIQVLRAASGCRHIVNIHQVFDEIDTMTIVFEFLQGQPLLDQLLERESIRESDAKEIARNLLSAINFCHKQRIAIRGLTLDNIIMPEGGGADLKLYDFEFAKKVPFPNSLRTQCGVQEYVAPEVLEKNPAYDVECDIWSAGVIIFLILGGYYPFRGKTEEETLKNLRYGVFAFRSKYWKDVSINSKSLIRRMLKVHPEGRITAKDALMSDWMEIEIGGVSADLTKNMRELRLSIEEGEKVVYGGGEGGGGGGKTFDNNTGSGGRRHRKSNGIRISVERKSATYFGLSQLT